MMLGLWMRHFVLTTSAKSTTRQVWDVWAVAVCRSMKLVCFAKAVNLSVSGRLQAFIYPTYEQTSSILLQAHPGIIAKTIDWFWEMGTIQIENESMVEKDAQVKKVTPGLHVFPHQHYLKHALNPCLFIPRTWKRWCRSER